MYADRSLLSTIPLTWLVKLDSDHSRFYETMCYGLLALIHGESYLDRNSWQLNPTILGIILNLLPVGRMSLPKKINKKIHTVYIIEKYHPFFVPNYSIRFGDNWVGIKFHVINEWLFRLSASSSLSLYILIGWSYI